MRQFVFRFSNSKKLCSTFILLSSSFWAKAAEILLRYAEAYPGPHTSNLEGGMIYQSLDESMSVIPLAQAYDLIYESLNESKRKKIEDFLGILIIFSH